MNLEVSYEPPPLHEVDLPFVLDADEGQWWMYFKDGIQRDTSDTGKGIAGMHWDDQEDEFENVSDILVEFHSVDAEEWPERDKFMAGAFVNFDDNPGDGVLLSLANGSESKFEISITEERKVKGYVKNGNGDEYELESVRPVHPGFNLLTVSYERNGNVKLGVNAKVVATDTASDHPLFDEALALSIGARVLTNKSVESQLKEAVVDDVWVASDALSDAGLEGVYMTYLTAAPLMLLENVTEE